MGMGLPDSFALGRMDHLNTVSQGHERGTRAFTASVRNDSDQVFRAAVRHSRHVRLLRVAIPLALVLGGLTTIVVATWLDPLRALARLPVNIGGLVVSGSKITMQQPRIAGFTSDERPYTITARAAAQDIGNPDVLELQDLHATMETQDRGAVEVSARTGVYDAKTDKLTLRQNVVFTTSSYQGHLSEAVVNIRSGHVVSEKAVEVKMLQGTINANRLEVIESGAVIRFDLGVTVEMMMDSNGAVSERRASRP